MHNLIYCTMNKIRKYIIICMALFVIVCIYISIKTIKHNENIDNIESKVIHTSATPITSHVIVIDAGHGIPDSGAEGLYGTTEEAINLKIALKLQRLIEQSGGVVYLTRSDENGIYSESAKTIKEKKVSDIRNRVEIGNNDDVEIFVSIHLNKFEDSKYSGWQTFYQEDNEESKKIAELIQESLNNTIEYPNNRVAKVIKDIYIMEHVKKPAVIVECGFLSNDREVQLLRTDEYQNELAWGIYLGIQEYFSNY